MQRVKTLVNSLDVFLGISRGREIALRVINHHLIYHVSEGFHKISNINFNEKFFDYIV